MAAQTIWRPKTKKNFAECRGMALGKGGLCRVPRIRHSAKRVLNFFKKIHLCRVPSQGTRQRHLKKIKSLSSAVPGALGKVFKKIKKIFAECRARGTRQSIFQKKNLPSAPGTALGKDLFFLKKNLCRVLLLRHSAKRI